MANEGDRRSREIGTVKIIGGVIMILLVFYKTMPSCCYCKVEGVRGLDPKKIRYEINLQEAGRDK